MNREMDWKKLLGSVPDSVDQELRLRNEYLLAENRILRQQVRGRLLLTDSDRKALAALGQQLGRKALAEIATVAQADTILAWNRTFAAQKCDGAKPSPSVGRPRINQEMEDLGDFRERFYCDRVSMPNAPQDIGNPHSVGRSYGGHARREAGIP